MKPISYKLEMRHRKNLYPESPYRVLLYFNNCCFHQNRRKFPCHQKGAEGTWEWRLRLYLPVVQLCPIHHVVDCDQLFSGSRYINPSPGCQPESGRCMTRGQWTPLHMEFLPVLQQFHLLTHHKTHSPHTILQICVVCEPLPILLQLH